MSRVTTFVGCLIAVLAGMLLMWGVQRGAGPRATADLDNPPTWDDSEAGVPTTSNDPMWGSRTAPVTLVLYSDYECPYCGKVEKTIDALKDKYGPEQLRVIWKHNPLPFHKAARSAHVAAETVFKLGGNDAFWKFHKEAFDNSKALTPDNFAAWAAEAGVDRDKFQQAFGNQDFAKKIDDDLASGKAVGVRGTPASFINGVLLSGAKKQQEFEEVIDRELAAARALIQSGTPADKVYIKRSLENRGKPPSSATSADSKPERAREKDPEKDDKTVWKVSVDGAPSKGPADALVTIVQFSDFECPYCEKVEPTIAELMKLYAGKVRVVWRHRWLPVHRRALPMALFAIEARAQKGDQGFWSAHEALFKRQREIVSREPDKAKIYIALEEDLLKAAAEIGLDADKVRAVVRDADPQTPMFETTPEAAKHQGIVDADADAADELDAPASPHFFVNGRRIVGAQPLEAWKPLIDEELKKAEELVAKGVKKADVYAEIMKEAKEQPPPETKSIAPAPAEAPFKGSEKAKVEMHVFSDFECPYCKRAEGTIATVEKVFGDRFKIVWRDRPLSMHKHAPQAAEAAREALAQKGRVGFWKFHEALFAAQGTPDGLSRAGLDRIAEQQGLDTAKFREAMDGAKHKAAVDADSAAAEAAGISSTPAFVITYGKDGDKLAGYVISGAASFGKFKRTINLALGSAGAKPATAPTAPDKPPAPPRTAPAPPKPPPPAPPKATSAPVPTGL